MPKGIFAKYLTTFILLTVISFLLISFAAVATVTFFTVESRNEAVKDTALSVQKYIESEYAHSEYEELSHFAYYNEDLLIKNISLLIRYNEGMSVIITRADGTILIRDNYSGKGGIKIIPSEITGQVTQKNGYHAKGTLGGMFKDDQTVHGERIYNKSRIVCGYVFVSQPYVLFDELARKFTILTLSFSAAAVLAICLATYFRTRKISMPLLEMSRAAKNFANEKFDTRVPVTGQDELTELAIAFNSMAETLEHNEKNRRDLLANVSHDLKTPMTTISGFIDAMLGNAVPPEKYDYYLRIIKDEIQRLSRLVSELLDISKIQAGERKFTMLPFDICEMARLIIISFEQKIEAKDLQVEFSADDDRIYVLADRDAIYQTLYNLCDNAIKFSREGGLFKINIINKEEKSYISVYNEGIGIDAAELPFVFDRFYKSDKSRGLDRTGTGLGLYIAKAIINAHNQEIWVKSTAGEYCEFVFTLKSTIPTQAIGGYDHATGDGDTEKRGQT